jgi:hypothetical protein
LWTEVTNSTLDTQILSFPIDEAASTAGPASIAVPDSAELAYQALPGGSLRAGPRVSLRRHPGTVSPSGVAVNPVVERELVLAARVQAWHRHGRAAGQISTLFLQDGVPTAYQLLSLTPGGSLAPAVVSDGAGQLYVTWLERVEEPGFAVYVASTAIDVQAALGAVTWRDVGRVGVETLFGLVTGALLAPLALLAWFVAPSLVLALTWVLRRGGESLTDPGARISLAATFVAYWAVKLVTLADARAYVPFSAWVPAIPPWLEGPLQAGVPAAIAFVALGTAWRFAGRSETKSAALCAVVYAAVDSLLTTAVYGVLFYEGLGLAK